MYNEPIDVILTSFNRFDLLEHTLDSFFYTNDYPINNFHVYDDFGTLYSTPKDKKALEILKEKYPQITWITPSQREGQIWALDNLWEKVATKYCFQMEDDWCFYRWGYIQDSINVLEQEDDIVMCWLRERNDMNHHHIVPSGHQRFDYLDTNFNNMWGGYTFNPSVKRLSDYKKIGCFLDHTSFDKNSPWKSESDISMLYSRLGYKAAVMNKGYVKHIGKHRGIRK